MVINLRRHRRLRADESGRTWWVGFYRRNNLASKRYRCFLDGTEVTNDCFYVDSRRGVVRLFLKDSDGHHYTDENGEPAEVERRGYVKLIRRKVAA